MIALPPVSFFLPRKSLFAYGFISKSKQASAKYGLS